MNKTSSDEYKNLSDKRIGDIVNVLKDFPYTEKEMETRVCPFIAQWLYDNYISIESTCLIISDVININRLQETINNIYEQHMPPLPAKSELEEFLTTEEYYTLEKAIEPREYEGTLRGIIDQENFVKINFKTKKIMLIKKSKGKNQNNKIIPVVEAVPVKLIVYDSPLLDQPRTFKIVWSSHVSSRNFTTAGEGTGATINEITNYLVDAGFSHNPKLVSGIISCTINTMIAEKYAEIKTDIDNPGIYYNVNNDKITAVKLPFDQPSDKSMKDAIDVLNELHGFYQDNSKTLATVFKWGLMSVFSYAMKQTGKWMPWMYLKGSAGSGKTTVAKVILYIYGEPSSENNVGGSSADTVARLGALISKSCLPRIVNEPAAVFNRQSTNEMVKVSVESTTGRSKYKGSYFGGIPAFSPILFTANQYLPEDDALIRRLYVLSFSYSQRKSEYEIKKFEDAFHINTPAISKLKRLNAFGRFAIREVMSNPSLLLDEWQDSSDYIVSEFYKSLGLEVPDWLKSWAESESLDDLDDTQREDIRNFFISEFNNARTRKVTIEDAETGVVMDSAKYIDGVSSKDDFASVNWGIINNRILPYAIPHVSRNETRYVCFTQALRKRIGDKLDFCSDLKSLGELVGWKYAPVRFGEDKVMKVLKVKFDDFLDFMYPNIELED